MMLDIIWAILFIHQTIFLWLWAAAFGSNLEDLLEAHVLEPRRRMVYHNIRTRKLYKIVMSGQLERDCIEAERERKQSTKNDA